MPRKGVMGIGTLIIFIAMILVAAVAAGVILRTAGVLQQRAYSVGAETRQRILSSVEISSVVAHVNLSDHTTKEFEIMIRLRAGSYPIPMETTGFTFFTKNTFISAKLQDSEYDRYIDNDEYNISNISTEWKEIGDIDEDGIKDKIRIDNSTGNASLEVWLSKGKKTFKVNLSEYNLTAGNNVTIQDLKLFDSDTEDIWGFVQANGTVLQDNTFVGLTAHITEFPVLPEHQTCTFENLIPERYYCVQIKLGKNDDVHLESGEIFVVLYKLKNIHKLEGDEEYGFKFIPKRGQETELYDRTPDVLGEATQILYPR